MDNDKNMTNATAALLFAVTSSLYLYMSYSKLKQLQESKALLASTKHVGICHANSNHEVPRNSIDDKCVPKGILKLHRVCFPMATHHLTNVC